jgi:hypothetical protein
LWIKKAGIVPYGGCRSPVIKKAGKSGLLTL